MDKRQDKGRMMYEDERALGLVAEDTRPKREHVWAAWDWDGPRRNWPPDQTRSRKARMVAKLRKERRR